MFTDPGGLKPRPYEPNKWNDGGDIQYNTNFYAYALDFYGEVTYGRNKGLNLPVSSFALQPGDLANEDYVSLALLNRFTSAKSMSEYAHTGSLIDAISNGHVFRKASTDNIAGKGLGENEWVVYLVAASSNEDYHWYRRILMERGHTNLEQQQLLTKN